MQDELLAPGAALAHLAIERLGFPARENPRLLLRKAGLHREIGLRQEDRVSVIALFAHKSARLSGGGAQLQFVRSQRRRGAEILRHAETRRRGGDRPAAKPLSIGSLAASDLVAS